MSATPGSSSVERPSWMRMVVLAGLAAVIGGIAIAGAEALLALTRLDGDPGLLRLPRETDDGWEWTSYATKAALACWLFAWAGRCCVRNWTDGWDMHIGAVAVAVGIALASLDRNRSLTPAGFALVVVVARNVALMPRPARRLQPSRWERIGAFVAITALAVAALTYRPLHPLAAAFADRGESAGINIGTGADPSRRYSRFAFWIKNEGPAAVTVRSIHAYDEAPTDVDVMTDRTDALEARSIAALHRPLDSERLASGEQLRAWLQLARSSCSGPYRVRGDEVRALVVRYETLGVTGKQWLRIHPPARLRCPARH